MPPQTRRIESPEPQNSSAQSNNLIEFGSISDKDLKLIQSFTFTIRRPNLEAARIYEAMPSDARQSPRDITGGKARFACNTGTPLEKFLYPQVDPCSSYHDPNAANTKSPAPISPSS
ncbi:hypothetical protein N7468_010664 [Penicillium chermesinum]|uniref:Uncharacterized protein n=1 Tax=Penicillium chermesinum TaxID=63820 RepID=A0A9W9TAZ8_9EURO|nr:uncharacterized protein N7468_010664 [Penicillium chermesinum]KAJ5214985.1 hypothetical protein N7468_010664 [Penicillium chermesinum]